MSGRVIRLSGTIDEALAEGAIARLLFLEQENPRSPIELRIDSDGGPVVPGMALVDTIAALAAPVVTVCERRAGGMAAHILASGHPGHRSAWEGARVIVGPLWDSARGGGQSPESLRVARRLAEHLAGRVRRPASTIAADLLEGRTLDAKAALDYGLIDRVVRRPAAVAEAAPGGVLFEVTAGALTALVAMTLADVAEVPGGQGGLPSFVRASGAAGLGGLVAGLLARRREWVRGLALGCLLATYHVVLGRLGVAGDAFRSREALAVGALLGGPAGAVIAHALAAPGFEVVWTAVRTHAGAVVIAARIVGALAIAAAAAGPLAGWAGFPGFLLVVFAGLFRAPLVWAASFMEDKCHGASRERES